MILHATPGEMIAIKKSMHDFIDGKTDQFAFRHTIIAKRDEDQFVFGPVLVANVRDGQGHIYDDREVELAAWRFAANGFQQGFMHQVKLTKNQVLAVESVIWRPEVFGKLKVGKTELPGSVWMMGSLLNDELWKLYKDKKIGGFSIEGNAASRPG